MASLIPSVCLSLAGSAWAAAAAAAGGTPAPPPADYQHAVESFNREDYEAAAALLAKIPESGNPKERADVLNLRGAISLHQHHFETARACFAQARVLDPSLWAAGFNEAEANFQEKNYREARRQFSALLESTPASAHAQEYGLVQYKALLSGVLAGDGKPAQTFLTGHGKDAQPPASYYFLHAALEYRQAHQHEAGQWLAQASAKYPYAAEQVYAETFSQLGWSVPRTERASAVAETNGSVVPLGDGQGKASAVYSGMGAQTAAAAQKLPPATLAVVQLIPGHHGADVKPTPPPKMSDDERPAFRFGGPLSIPLPAEEPAVQNLPPAPADDLRTEPGVEGGMLVGGGLPPASTLARHRSHASPSPSTPAASPDATASGDASPAAGDTAAASASPSPGASPDASASQTASAAPAQPAFVQKYEAAYVKFIQKDYAGAKALLDEADAIQANQPSSISLRGQIFKHYYEEAYVAYLKADYTGALGELDLAEGVQPSQPDAANLRGLVYSRQHNYEQAESMFKKAITSDPTFWAAKFNLAELPFNYRNYTSARARFEDLFSQTDPVKQPREAELTQFKVFLTLLLEGKEAAARSFMEHFTYSGSTPARYFCQSALDFYHGDVDKAMGWLDSAKKEYPAQLVSIFIESFYRVGWMTDPTAHPEVANSAVGTTTPAPAAAPSASPALAAASSSPAPPASIAKASPAASASPAIVAKATPAASASPAIVAKVTPAASASPAIVAKTTPAASASPTAVAKATPAASASPAVIAKATPAASASPAPTAVVLAAASPTPGVPMKPTAAFAPTVIPVKPLVLPSASPAPTAMALASPLPSAPAKVVALATPAGTPGKPASFPSASPAASVAAFATPAATPVKVIVAATTPAPTAQPSAAAVAVVKATPAPAFLAASATPAPTAAVAAKPTATVALPALVAAASATPAPTESMESPSESAAPETAAETPAAESSSSGDGLRILIVLIVIGQMVMAWWKALSDLKRRRSRGPGGPAGSPRSKAVERDKVDAPR